MLQIVLGTLQGVKEVWISTQTFSELWKNGNTWKRLGSFWDFFLPDNLEHIMQVDLFFPAQV